MRWSWEVLDLQEEWFWDGGHSLNHAALATRKLCQNHEFPDRQAATISAAGASDRRSGDR
jgi:hypothetical protein